MITVLLRQIKDHAVLPEYKTSNSSGVDLHACLHESIIIKPNERKLIECGIAVELLSCCEAQIRSRSGLTLNRGLVVANGIGTIDADYRGEICVILHNISDSNQEIKNGDRIAQMIFSPVFHADFDLVEELSKTDRGEKGFGSTGTS